MNKKYRRVGLGLVALLVLLMSSACAIFDRPHAQGDLKSYANTLQGLNTDMRETLHRIREGHHTEANTELLHDQLHLMRDVLHLVSKEQREDVTFQTLHNLNHEMRETWHAVKKGRDREANLGKLHEQLHEMKQTIEKIIGQQQEQRE